MNYRLCRVHRRIQKGFDVFEYYANNQWDFDNTNALYMRSILNELEAKRYAIDEKSMLLFFLISNLYINYRIVFFLFHPTRRH